jgi:hypothetical protein
MATKDWKQHYMSEGNNITWFNIKNDRQIRFYGKEEMGWEIVIREGKENKGTIDSDNFIEYKSFDSKSKALAFAKSYMRKN